VVAFTIAELLLFKTTTCLEPWNIKSSKIRSVEPFLGKEHVIYKLLGGGEEQDQL
jgi:hypothetical protein